MNPPQRTFWAIFPVPGFQGVDEVQVSGATRAEVLADVARKAPEHGREPARILTLDKTQTLWVRGTWLSTADSILPA